jgi:peptidoglycan-associated lipoprotein
MEIPKFDWPWAAAAIFSIGCASDPKPAPAFVAPPFHGPGTSGPTAVTTQKSPTRSQVRISEEIRRACGISEADAHFAFDSARLRAFDHPSLNTVAKCFRTGPLAGRSMRLVGHADPRGEAEYNMVLGGQRADNVKLFLLDKGLKSSQVSTTSRGELEAKGRDESSWAEDRRVDMLLGQ